MYFLIPCITLVRVRTQFVCMAPQKKKETVHTGVYVWVCLDIFFYLMLPKRSREDKCASILLAPSLWDRSIGRVISIQSLRVSKNFTHFYYIEHRIDNKSWYQNDILYFKNRINEIKCIFHLYKMPRLIYINAFVILYILRDKCSETKVTIKCIL